MEWELEPFSMDDIDGPMPPDIEPTADGQAMLRALLEQIVAFCDAPRGISARMRRADIARMRRYGVPYSPCAWFGDNSPAQRQRYSRTALRLERDGYLIRITERQRDRVTRVRPTSCGVSWALRRGLVADVAALAAGLKRTDWGAELAKNIESDPGSAPRSG